MIIKKDRFLRSEFLRNVMTLMPGTLLSQAIPILFSIVLARIYSPELFGIYFLFTAILGLAIIFSTGKYELAVLLPEKDEEAAHLIGIALTTCIVFCLVLLSVFALLNQWISGLFKTSQFGIWLLILPLSIFFSAANEVFYYWHNRKKRFKLLSWSKIIQSLTSSSLQLILGFLVMGETGLIVGLVLGQATSFVFLLLHFRNKDRDIVRFSLFNNYKTLAKKYLNFPRDIAVAAFVNEAANQLPNIFMTRFLGPTVVGHYGYAQRTVRTPLGVISNAFSDVYKSRAAADYIREGSVKRIFFNTLKSLFLIGFIPFLILFFLAPLIFAWLFGSAFETSGYYTRYLCVPLFLGFVVSPLTSTFYIINKTATFLHVQLLGLFLVVLALVLAYYWSGSATVMVISLAVAISASTLSALAVLLYFVLQGHKKKDPPELFSA